MFWLMADVTVVLARTVETQPLMVGTAVGIFVTGISDGVVLGIKVGADVRNITHRKTV